MPELNGLPEIDPADVSDDDFILIFDNSAPSSRSRKSTRANLLKDVAREGGDHNFGTSEINDLTVSNGTIINLNVTTGIKLDTGATLKKLYREAAAIAVSDLPSGTGQTVTIAVAGVAVGDFVSLSFSTALSDGLIAQAWVSAPGTISVRLFNTTSVTIVGAPYTVYLAAMRFL
tara:strand:- start:5851 stop:6372 length:522 start_codon:yes stop_codon:yes gene_type:complete